MRARDIVILVHLEDTAQRLLEPAHIEMIAVQVHERHRPIEALGDAGRLLQGQRAKRLHQGGDLGRQPLGEAGEPGVQNGDFLLERRIRQPEKQAAAAERIRQLARPVARDNDARLVRRANRPDLGDRHLPLGQHLEQERLKSLVGAIDFVDEQHRRPPLCDCLEQRALQQEPFAEDLRLALLNRGVLGLAEAGAQHLTRVVPLVQRRHGVEAFVAL